MPKNKKEQDKSEGYWIKRDAETGRFLDVKPGKQSGETRIVRDKAGRISTVVTSPTSAAAMDRHSKAYAKTLKRLADK